MLEPTDQITKSSLQKTSLPPIMRPDKPKRDYLPENLLTTLTQAGKKFQDLGPKGMGHRKAPKKRPDNLWNHEKSRGKFKHLIEQPPCFCGAGSDISYLMDATKETGDTNNNGTNPTVPVDNKIVDHGKAMIPESIIPAEFHIIKHKGVVGLEIHNDEYATQTDEHDKHLTIFPSMKPSGRQEALQLMQIMNSLLKKAGVEGPDENEEETKEHATGDQSEEESQIESLLKLVKEEQKIYNIVFNEVIRQVSVECIERGAILSELRKRYAKMLDRVPRQVKSLHEEVLAQRALDRRLTEELSRFKTSITLLTKELHEIHAHDEEVTRQAIETQTELNDALKESEKNASLLAEYHDLYELQRRRLDYQLSKLIEERDLWAGSAHMLSMKVTDKHNLVTVRRLHLYEKAWHKLANRFTVLLGQKDATQLQGLANYVHQWQETAYSFDEKLRDSEQGTYRRMKSIQTSLQLWSERFDRVVTPNEGSVQPFQHDDLQDLFNSLKSWEETFNSEVERFSGEVLLSCEDDLLRLTNCVDSWVDSAINVFNNHPTQDGSPHPKRSAMLNLNKDVEKLHSNFQLRMTGENGLVKGYIHFINTLDTWVNKINVLLHGGEVLFDSEWVQLADFMQSQWPECMQQILYILSPDKEPEVEGAERLSVRSSKSARSDASGVQRDSLDVGAMTENVQRWLQETINAFENENTNMMEQVSTTHWNMIRWLISILIKMAPDYKSANSPIESAEEDRISSLGAAILKESAPDIIVERCTMIFNWLRSLTDLIVACCKDLTKGSESNKDNLQSTEQLSEVVGMDSAKDAKEIEKECQGWMVTANLLIKEVTGQSIPLADFIPITDEKTKNKEQESTTLEQQQQEYSHTRQKSANTVSSINVQDDDNLPVTPITPQIDVTLDPVILETDDNETIEKDETPTPIPATQDDSVGEMLIIGNDDNVKKRNVQEIAEHSGDESSKLDLASSSMSLEALSTLEQLQNQLVETEERAQKAEERAYVAESALKEAQERIRALERSINRIESKSELDGSFIREKDSSVQSIVEK